MIFVIIESEGSYNSRFLNEIIFIYPLKSAFICAPSQYGLLFDCPHLQNAVVLFLVSVYPSLFVTFNVPYTNSGPFSNTSIFVSKV